MKLGTQTGSLNNHLYSRSTKGQPMPEVGMGATMLQWTDRHAGTIAEVLQVGKSIIIGVKRDRAKLVKTDEQSYGSNEYTYERDDEAPINYYRAPDQDSTYRAVRKNPETGRWVKAGSAACSIGFRDEYYDYSF